MTCVGCRAFRERDAKGDGLALWSRGAVDQAPDSTCIIFRQAIRPVTAFIFFIWLSGARVTAAMRRDGCLASAESWHKQAIARYSIPDFEL